MSLDKVKEVLSIKLEGLKEIMCALIGLIILGGAVWMLHDLYVEAGKTGADFVAEVYQRHSQLLNLVLGFAGTVVGYYFGRTPAEKLANNAQAKVQESAVREGVALQKRDEIHTIVQDARSELLRAARAADESRPTQQDMAIRAALMKLERVQ